MNIIRLALILFLFLFFSQKKIKLFSSYYQTNFLNFLS
jgi:hypothetical protein